MRTEAFSQHIQTYTLVRLRSRMAALEEAKDKSGMEKLCDALQVGLTLIGGRPRMGSSTFAVALAMELAKSGQRVLYCAHRSQDIDAILYHYLCSEVKHDIASDSNTKDDWVAIDEGLTKLQDIHFYTADFFGQTSIQELETHIWNEMRDKDIQYVFIDCLQDINVDRRIVDRRHVEETLCDRFRELSIQLNIPVIVCAYQDRILRYGGELEDNIPQPDCFLGGEISIYARQMFLLYRPEFDQFYKDEKTDEDLRGKMFVFAKGGVGGLNDEIQLIYDARFARVKDVNPGRIITKLTPDTSTEDLPF